MCFENFQKNLQDKMNEITLLENDQVMQRWNSAASRTYEDLDRFYLNRMKIDALINEMHEVAKVYYGTKNKKG